ncbi:histone-like transcription factor CBF/NF-Y and archaeal histone domain-containing protein [Theileria equi strain WA]|uniref:Histone-like transcription factor CBF/NF-Y and archaeal histone domain-containing protein n=1 Tax=Theileria equi strain WA TaxID=1537102 RepID=L0B0E5_THEEQ|nr:histone-like transcription factor CBF/NF-Y and archaeal histone domain-containing protein [Theileria equi strain WA]AFZ80736.1 histone-like transcription factor CBF/NF-Y and archaeal histone domain-containing protein [Theileria equi strain WA]|eukprot:XP_004830402.1 histone-like transcription factor CBF/NF-Y and archaeal histone domain-containing protein [Theileria equi strain WA]
MSESSISEPRDDIYDYKSTYMNDEVDQNRNAQLPVARVKKIMKEGEHSGMISADAPVILAKACEMLIKELTLQSWTCTLLTRRCTLQKQDITSAIFKSNIYNFLYDVLTPEELRPKMESQLLATQRTQGIHINPRVNCQRNGRLSIPPGIQLIHERLQKRSIKQIHPYRLPQLGPVAPIQGYMPTQYEGLPIAQNPTYIPTMNPNRPIPMQPPMMIHRSQPIRNPGQVIKTHVTPYQTHYVNTPRFNGYHDERFDNQYFIPNNFN